MTEELRLSRYKGCLLGGAVGDALGYPVEFLGETSIYYQYTEQGIRELSEAGNPARISDDTQMTLFAAEGIMMGDVRTAYLEWLGTQGDTSHMDTKHPKTRLFREPRLHAMRAPGNTCMSALIRGGGSMKEPLNHSKGCGTVMRAAPSGLACGVAGEKGDAAVYRNAVSDAAITHGSPMAWCSANALAQMVHEIIRNRPERDYRLEDVVTMKKITAGPALTAVADEAAEKLELAVSLALDPSVGDLDGIHMLGEGWVADEALYIAVFCAVRYQDDFAAAIRAAVNHRGDSDSTGAVCGNLLGAWLGEKAVREAYDLNDLELADVIEDTAERLYRFAAEQNRPRHEEGI